MKNKPRLSPRDRVTLQLQALPGAFRFTESPRWHNGRLWFVDVLARQVLTMEADGAHLRVMATLDGAPGGLGFLPDGTPIVVSADEFRLLKIAPDGSLSRYADLSQFARGALNDMLIDDHGRAYVGHYGYDAVGGAPFTTASLIMVTPDGHVSEVAQGLSFPNGMALIDAGATLVVAETFANQLSAFPVDGDGKLGAGEVWASLPDLNPDGIAADATGAIWAGCAYVGQFVRVERGGHISNRILTGGPWAVACAIGGADGRSLFGLTSETSFEQFAAGVSQSSIGGVDLSGLPR